MQTPFIVNRILISQSIDVFAFCGVDGGGVCRQLCALHYTFSAHFPFFCLPNVCVCVCVCAQDLDYSKI